MIKDLLPHLRDMGFSPKECQVYLHLFKQGAATAQEIHKAIKIPLSTVYNILDIFKHSGLISYLESKPEKKYILESPKQIIKYIQENFRTKEDEIKKEYENKRKTFEDSLHKFMSAKDSIKPRVRFHEGAQGAIELREDILAT